jgi:hypothetical protein
VVCPETTWNTKAAITSTGVFQVPIQRGFSTRCFLERKYNEQPQYFSPFSQLPAE